MNGKRGDYHGSGERPVQSGGTGTGPASDAAREPGAPRGSGAARAGATALVLAAAFAIGLALRLAPLATDPQGELVADAAFHLRMIEEVAARGRVPAIDPMCEAPEGRAVGAMLPTGLYYATAGLDRGLAPLDGRDLRFHALLFTALAGALIVVPAYFAARAVFASPSAARFAPLLAAVIPGHVHRTHAFWLRYDALGALLATVHVALMLHALAAPDRRRMWLSAALAGVALLAAAACWRVALVIPFVELAFALAWTVWRGATREVRDPVTIVIWLFTILSPVVPYLRAQPFVLSAAWIAALVATQALRLPWMEPAPRRWPVRGALLAAVGIVAWVVVRQLARPDPYSATFALIPAKLAAAFGARHEVSPIVALELTIQELTSLGPFGFAGPGVLSWLAPWFVAALLLVRRKHVSAPAPAPALFAALCVAMTLGTMLFERNKVLLAPLVAVACGGVAAARIERARPAPATRADARRSRGPNAGFARRGGAPAIALATLLAACVAVTAWHATALALSRRSALRPALREALAFLRERTPEGAIVVSPWEHGYEVQAHARRASVMDGLIESPANQQRMIDFAEAAMMSAPDSLAAFCRRHRAGWLLVPPSTQLYAVAIAARSPIAAKLRAGTALTPAEADRVLLQMMVLGRAYPGFEKVFERDRYRVYRVEPANAP